jgi:phage tail sheath protein FI
MPTYDVPGVYIEEQTGPGVIVGVGTSTAAFIGPALKGPINEPQRISSFDEFLSLYATAGPDGVPFPYITEPRPFYLAHAVRGFYENGGGQAYIVRAGTGQRAQRTVNNQGGQAAFVVEAQQEGAEGDTITVATELSARQRLAVGSATVTALAGGGTVVTVNNPSQFRVGDVVTEDNTDRATITQIQGDDMTLDAALAGLAVNDTLRIANIPPAQATFRLNDVTGLRAGATALLSGDDAANPGTPVTDPVVLQGVNTATRVVTLAAAPARSNTYNLNVGAGSAPVLIVQHIVVVGSAPVTAVAGVDVTVNDATPFRVGDVVTEDNTARATITQITGNVLTLGSALAGLAVNDTLRIANIIPGQTTIRVTDITGLVPGGVVRIEGEDAANPANPVANPDFAIIQRVDAVNNVVALRPSPSRAHTYRMDVAQANAPTLNPWEFRLIVTPPPGSGRPVGRFYDLSLESAHPRYIFNQTVLDEIEAFESGLVRVNKPPQPPIAGTFPDRLVALTPATPLAGGVDDQLATLGAPEYQTALDALRDIDDVNLVCIPDAASHPARLVIQQAMINHCLALKGRFAILDSELGAPPSGSSTSGTPSVEQHRQFVQSENGFAALYYPWLEVVEPIPPTSLRPLTPRRMFVPPSGHVAGVFARTDEERGVHKAPANVPVRGVLGLERKLSDGQHGPLNLQGINVLRIFPGTAQVMVWGARTTVQKEVTDWIYVNVRRLMLFIEESIEEGIRFAVFEPNNLALWQKLKRTISEFLSRVWRDGALFGAKPEQAFYVRIDEALNPPSVRALGRLYIEIAVAPVRPAEFIIVRIGLWDGGSEVREG